MSADAVIDVTELMTSDPADVRRSHIRQLLGCTTPALRAMILRKQFPPPDVRYGRLGARWRRSTIRNWLAEQAARRETATAV